MPRPKTPVNTSWPPRTRAKAVATLPRHTMRGMNSAPHRAARTAAVRMVPVSSRNSWPLRSSRTRVLVVTAPMMPSLKAPVMRLLAARTRRCWRRILRWKNTHSTAMTGATERISRPSFQFMASSITTMPTTKKPDQHRSTRLQAIISERRATSLPRRAISQPTEVVS